MANVTPRMIETEFTESAQTETATIENLEHLDLISESPEGRVCGDLVIQLIGKCRPGSVVENACDGNLQMVPEMKKKH